MSIILTCLGQFEIIAADFLNETGVVYYSDAFISPCLKVLTASAQFGCPTSFGSEGILIDFKSFQRLSSSTSGLMRGEKYALVYPLELFTPAAVNALPQLSSVAFIILPAMPPSTSSNNQSTPSPTFKYLSQPIYKQPANFSEDDLSAFNPFGRSTTSQKINVPVMAILPNNVETLKAVDRSIDYNDQRSFQTYPLVSSSYVMDSYAAQNSKVCLDRSQTQPAYFCFPAGGASVIASPQLDIPSSIPSKIVYISAPIDTKSIFNYGLNGMSIPVGPVAVALTVAAAFGQQPGIVYSLFDTESFDLSGSRRFFETQNLFGSSVEPDLFVDIQGVVGDDLIDVVMPGAIGSAVGGLWTAIGANTIQGDDSWRPKSSLTSARIKYGSGVPFIHISNGATVNRDKFRYGIVDDPQAPQRFNNTCKVAQAIVDSVVNLKSLPTRPVIDCSLATELMSCLSQNFSCALSQSLFDSVSGTTISKSSVATIVTAYHSFIYRFLLTALKPTAPLKSCVSGCDAVIHNFYFYLPLLII